ncbi:hypothetical protein [Bailinhaonella thermotolerans]|nr:hypothetical protein [Bailinhaonella thermotolerans]
MRLRSAATAATSLVTLMALLIALASPAHATSYSLYGDNGYGSARLDYTYYASSHPSGWYVAYTDNTNLFDDGGDGYGTVIRVTYNTPSGSGSELTAYATDGDYSYGPEYSGSPVRDVRFYLCRYNSRNGTAISPCVRMTT